MDLQSRSADIPDQAGTSQIGTRLPEHSNKITSAGTKSQITGPTYTAPVEDFSTYYFPCSVILPVLLFQYPSGLSAI